MKYLESSKTCYTVAMGINSYNQALKFLFSHIPGKETRVYSGELGLKRMKHLASLIGYLQESIPVIHIAGTSGKGSTATMITEILMAHGLKVGLHVSPHLVDIRERFQINRKLVSKEFFIETLNEVIPYVTQMHQSKFGAPTYFEINTALAYLIFKKKKVDVAVIETGLGGLLDGTNIVSNSKKLCVITRIGLDHTEILGTTLPEIASQKAGIIQVGNTVVALKQEESVQQVIKKVAKLKQAKLTFVETDKHLKLGVRGDFQLENASLAIEASRQWLENFGKIYDEKKASSVLKNISITGRFDVRQVHGKTVIIDGAHNPEKMTAFISSLKKYYPGRKFKFIIAFKKGKNYQDMLPIIMPLADTLVLTKFSSSQQEAIDMSEDPKVILEVAKNLGARNVSLSPAPKLALKEALDGNDEIIVITGSIYLQEEILRYLRVS